MNKQQKIFLEWGYILYYLNSFKLHVIILYIFYKQTHVKVALKSNEKVNKHETKQFFLLSLLSNNRMYIEANGKWQSRHKAKKEIWLDGRCDDHDEIICNRLLSGSNYYITIHIHTCFCAFFPVIVHSTAICYIGISVWVNKWAGFDTAQWTAQRDWNCL